MSVTVNNARKKKIRNIRSQRIEFWNVFIPDEKLIVGKSLKRKNKNKPIKILT